MENIFHEGDSQILSPESNESIVTFGDSLASDFDHSLVEGDGLKHGAYQHIVSKSPYAMKRSS